jgi:hypothetical protein
MILGSSTVLVELGKTDQYPLLKVDKVAETITHPFHGFDGIVNPLDHARGEAISEIV